jgi:predicted histidine transporter YuiF (NhaC family)
LHVSNAVNAEVGVIRESEASKFLTSILVAGVGLEVGFGAAFTATPLFQMSFLPDLMQVNFFPPETEVAPAFVHLAPALGVTACAGAARVRSKTIARARDPLRCMG